MAEDDESLEAPPWDDALVFDPVSALSARVVEVVERGAGWETDTRLELTFRRLALRPADKPESGPWYAQEFMNILKKKKKFDEIHVGSENTAKILGYLSFLHKAKVKYY